MTDDLTHPAVADLIGDATHPTVIAMVAVMVALSSVLQEQDINDLSDGALELRLAWLNNKSRLWKTIQACYAWDDAAMPEGLLETWRHLDAIDNRLTDLGAFEPLFEGLDAYFYRK